LQIGKASYKATLTVTQTNNSGSGSTPTWVTTNVTSSDGLSITGPQVSDLVGTYTIGLGSVSVARNYTLTISADGFDNITQEVTVKPVDATPTLMAQITANSLQIDKNDGSALLRVTETNTSSWVQPTLTLPTGFSFDGWSGSGLT
jgi:hypothetical protein